MKCIFRYFFLILSGYGITGYAQSVDHWETTIFNNDTWKYFVGLSEPDPGWRQLSFNDASWMQGPGGFGYGDDDDNTVIPACTSVYLRIKFNAADTSAIASALLSMDYDDGFVAYLNDFEIARVGISGEHPAYDQPGNDHEASMYREGSPESFIIDKNSLKLCLLPGENILCVQVHNSSSTSSDLTSNVWLSFGITNSSNDYRPVPSWFVPPFDFQTSYLPIILITTNPGETIMDEPKITAGMKIIFNGGMALNYISDPANVYDGKVGIEIRGRYSASLPQKPYGFETRDADGNNLDVSLLGMPPDNDWTLLANYNDKTFLRNYLAFEIFREMGHYSIRSRYCEVVVNNEYQGIYLLTEKIKIGENRVPAAILKPDENSGDEITGGYIFKNDYYTSEDSWLSQYSPINKPGASVYFVYHDPKPEVLTAYQKEYLKDFVDRFETTLYSEDFADPNSGYLTYIDIGSFVDYFIISEVTRNVDAYKKSRFYYKDKDSNSGVIHSGPVWDFDWAWKNILEDCIHMNQTDGSGWAYKINECAAWPVPPVWEMRFLQDDFFMNEVHDKYFLLRRNILSQNHLDHIIDSVATLLDDAQERHFQKWKILGINVGTPESGIQPATFPGEIVKFKSWINTRLNWLDSHMIGNFDAYKEGYKAICRISPNPAGENLKIESDTIINRIVLYNFSGVQVFEDSGFYDYSVSVNLTNLSQGFYIVRVFLSDGGIISRRLIKNK